jgi:predicted ATPase
MQLVYLWISDPREMIQEEDINFWGKFKFNIKKQSTSLNLTWTLNENYIDNFYGDKITEITAIVGKNGSGKSTLLKFIKENIATDIGNTNLSYFAILRNVELDTLFIYNSTGSKVNYDKDKEHVFEELKRGYYNNQLLSLLFPTAYIYYSNNIDYGSSHSYVPIDISTNYYLNNLDDLRKYQEEDNPFLRFTLQEIRRQVRFIIRASNDLPFDPPEAFQFEFRNLHFNKLTPYLSLESNSKEIAFLNKINSETEKYFEYTDNIIHQFYFRFWYNVVFLIFERKLKKYKTLNLEDFDYSFFRPNNIEESVTYFLDLIFGLLKNKTYEFQLASRARDFTYKISDNIENENIQLTEYGIEIKIDKKSNYSKYRFFRDSEQLGLDIFSFNWSGISTGESAFITPFSRLFDIKHEYYKFFNHINNSRVHAHNMSKIEKIENAVLLIDEGENNLHPEWQKAYINYLKDFIPKIARFKRIQIILSTNNPLIISDIPSSNCIFLEKKGRTTSVLEPRQESFGANILDLYKDAFFIKGGAIGEFSKSKINEMVTEILESKKISSSRLVYFMQLKNLIGNDVIKKKVEDLIQYYSKGVQ